jgi:hypothetical protein
MGDDWNEPRDKGPTQKTEELAEESASPQRHRGKRKKDPVDVKDAIRTLAYTLHSAYRG